MKDDAPAEVAEAPKRGGLEAEKLAQRALLQAVLERRLKPGAKLDEDVLSEVFNISRTRLRKVLSLLTTQLIVTHKPGYGSFVAKPSAAEARDVFQARHGIEDMIVRIVGAQQPQPDFKPLRRIVAEEERAHDQQSAGVIELSGDFHLLLADLAGNSLLRTYMQQLVTRTILVQALYSTQHICLVHDHADILDALERGDTATAAERMSRHLQLIEGSCVLREIDEQTADLRTIFKQAR